MPGSNKETYIQEESLLEVLKYYKAAQTAGVMPYWLTQFDDKKQAWQSFYQDRQSTPGYYLEFEFFLNSESANTSLAALPTKEAKPFAYADGWIWCVIPSDLDTEQEAVELAEFLTEASFINTWGVAAGYLQFGLAGLKSWSEHLTLPPCRSAALGGAST